LWQDENSGWGCVHPERERERGKGGLQTPSQACVVSHANVLEISKHT
jgi:hypothetical protein